MASTQLTRLQAHLQALRDDPNGTAIDKQLLSESTLVLPDTLSPQDLQDLVLSLAATLQTVREDATPLTTLLQRLLRPFSFADVLAFDPPIDFVSGLTVADAMAPVNSLMLSLLSKAQTIADVATIANWPQVVRALIDLWLGASSTDVASTASTLLVDMLKIDHQEISDVDEMLPDAGTGQGLLWKRLFTDQDVYRTIFERCDLDKAVAGKRQATLAQARVLEVLPTLAAMDWATVSGSHETDIERTYGIKDNGLMEFAALKMVDYENDVLTYWILVDFYSALLRQVRDTTTAANSSSSLEYLITTGIHQRVAGIYLNNADGIEALYLYGPAANYLGTYASIYPSHFMASPLPKVVLSRLTGALNQSASRYSHDNAREHDLQLLSRLPRKSLLPSGDGSGAWSTSPVSLLPSSASNSAVLDTLAKVFHGPVEEPIAFPTSSMVDGSHELKLEEAACARSLYLHYLASNQKLWKDVVAHADTIALVDTALAALRLLTAVITANWSTELDLTVPSSVIATPETGPLAILSPPALEYALPYLMKPPKTFANLVGGRGDTESAAYKIATAKYDALQIFHRRLAAYIESTPDSGLEDVLSTLGKRLAEGPFSRAGEVGGRVATLEL